MLMLELNLLVIMPHCHTSTIYARCSTHLYLYPENVSNLVKTKFIDRYEDMHKKYVEMQTKWI